MDETNPTVRSLRCLELLQDHPGITAARLGGLLGVSERAARRYVAILREAGLPIEAERGRYGGYRVGRGLRMRPLMFTAPEALSLVMAVLEGGHDADAADDPVQTALGKIMRVLPESLAGPAEAVRRVSTRTRGEGTPPPETTARLVEACGSSRRIRVDYRLGADIRTMELDPWAVVVRYGRWYLLCWSHTSGARRALRVDRVMSVELTGDAFVAPEGLDAAADLDDHLRQGWSSRVVVEIEAPLDETRRWVPQQLGRLEAISGTGPGRTRLVGSTDDLRWYVGHLAAFEAAYSIVEPTELQQTAHELGTRLLRAAESP